MNNKASTLGIGLGLVAALGAVVAAALAGRGSDRRKLATSGGAGDTSPVTPAIAGSQPIDANGPTARAQPAPTGDEGHAAPDLAAGIDLGPDHRAPEAFRPDMDVPMTAAEREALRPATGPSPSLVSDNGGTTQGVGGDRY